MCVCALETRKAQCLNYVSFCNLGRVVRHGQWKWQTTSRTLQLTISASGYMLYRRALEMQLRWTGQPR